MGAPCPGPCIREAAGPPLGHGEVGGADAGDGGQQGAGKCGLEGLRGSLLSPLPHPRLEETLVPWGLAHLSRGFSALSVPLFSGGSPVPSASPGGTVDQEAGERAP